ncbi:MAG: hypothetical protein HY016_08300 [Nitrosomonadales bacterium]|nr:hypothetical protein [Nitrosomonadales bacterium]
MKNKTTSNQAAPSIENTATLTATILLMDAIDEVSGFVPPRVDNPTEAILIGFHALIAKLDSMETHYINAVCDLQKSINSLSCRPDGEVVPTASESERMLGTLKADWLRQHPEHTEEEYREAMRRFEKLAGL